jgi:cytidylate kinase
MVCKPKTMLMKKNIITIAGNNGAGKSSASEDAAIILGYQKKSTGDDMRQMAKDRGITLEELSKIAETDPSIDRTLDESNIEIGKMNNVVVDARLAFHFIPESFKVFLLCDPVTAAKRITKDRITNPNRHNESTAQFETAEDIAVSLVKRLESERKRYFDLYGIVDHTDPSNFDLVIDTSKPENNKQEVPKIIAKAYQEWLKNS